MLPSLLTSQLKLTVMMNGIYVPFRQALENFGRFCRPLSLYNDGTVFELSIPGSAFLARIQGHNLLMATRHQLGKGTDKRSPSDVVIVLDELDQRVALTGNESFLASDRSGGIPREQDLLLLRFEDGGNGRDLRPNFLQLQYDQILDATELPPGSKALIHAIVGFPSRFTEYDALWDEEAMATSQLSITSRWSKLFLVPAARTAWDDDELTPYVLPPNTQLDIGDPDGFSGSPLVMLYQDASHQTHLALAGVVVKASQVGRFNVYGPPRLRAAIEGLRNQNQT